MPKPTFYNLPDEKKARIVQAAVDEFSVVAFEAASLNRIVKSAGIAKGSFYQYFDDLFDLFRWLVMEHLARQKMAYVSTLGPPPQGGDLFDQLAWAGLSGIRWGLSEPRLAACAGQLWSHSNFGPLAALQAELDVLGLAQMRHVLVDGQSQGLVREDLDLDTAAAMLMGMRETMDSAMKRRLGFGVMELCTRPELGANVDLEAVHEVVIGVVDLLRRAVGTGRPGGELHLDDTPFVRHLRGEP